MTENRWEPVRFLTYYRAVFDLAFAILFLYTVPDSCRFPTVSISNAQFALPHSEDIFALKDGATVATDIQFKSEFHRPY